MAWNSAFHLTPAGGSVPSQIDDKIRELKDYIEDRMKNHHTTYTGDFTEGAASSDWLHKKGSAVLYYQTTAPTIVNETAQAGLLWWDSKNEILKVRTGEAWVSIYQKDPVGTVKFWDTGKGGTFTNDITLPGWYMCDGTHDTPNMMEQFPLMSATSGTANDTNALVSGSESVTILKANLAAHTHTAAGLAHQHFGFADEASNLNSDLTSITYAREDRSSAFDNYDITGTSTLATVGLTSLALTASEATDSTGGDTDLDVTPPYYSLIPIIRIS